MKTEEQIKGAIYEYKKRLEVFKEKMLTSQEFMKGFDFYKDAENYKKTEAEYRDWQLKANRTQARLQMLEWVLDI